MQDIKYNNNNKQATLKLLKVQNGARRIVLSARERNVV